MNPDSPENSDKSLHIQISPEKECGAYSNLAVSNYSQEEFIIDFIFMQPQVLKGNLLSRLVVSPRNLKRLSFLLNAQINEYESKFGVISQDNSKPEVKLNFN